MEISTRTASAAAAAAAAAAGEALHRRATCRRRSKANKVLYLGSRV